MGLPWQWDAADNLGRPGWQSWQRFSSRRCGQGSDNLVTPLNKLSGAKKRQGTETGLQGREPESSSPTAGFRHLVVNPSSLPLSAPSLQSSFLAWMDTMYIWKK